MANQQDNKPDLIRERLRVSEVVGRQIQLTKQGSEFLGLCPFHDDSKPSFTVVDDKQFYHCFACGAHGDIFDFVQNTQGLTFPEAVKALSDMAGLDAAPAPRTREPKPKPRKVIKHRDKEWRMLPPPEGEDLPDLGHQSYTYHSADGRALMLVERDPNKKFTPWIWAETLDGQQRGWIPRHPVQGERPLYNLHTITHRPDDTVLIVEGEKAADAAQSVLRMPVTTSLAGSSGGKHADWSPLAGRKVIIWPDADEPGLKYQEDVATILRGLGCTVWVIDTDSFPQAWDAADAIEDGLDIKALLSDKRLRRKWRAKTERPLPPTPRDDSPPPPGLEDIVDPVHNAEAPPPGDPARDRIEWWAPRILGTVDNHIAAIPYNGSHIELMQSRKLTKSDLMNLARKDRYWASTHPGVERNGILEPDWDTAINDLQDDARKLGDFEAHNIRRRGVWIDADGKLLFNSGGALHDISLYDGSEPTPEPIPLSHHQGHYAYIGGPDLNQFVAPPGEGLTAAEGLQLVDILKEVSWSNVMSSRLLAGWIFAAPICGVLDWRSHIWLTGPHGSGKSTLLQKVIIPLLNNMVRAFEGGSTGAGVRQDLKSDALAVVYDEAEAEKGRNQSNFKTTMEQILDLARVSSSSAGGRVVKGTGTQTGAMSYFLHSMFCFSSIVIDIENAADDSRITRLEIMKNTNMDAEDSFQRFQQLIHQTITVSYRRRFLRRCMDQAPYIRKNAEIFSEILSRILQNRRSADQLSTLVAGYFGLVKGGLVSREQAEKFCTGLPWHEATSQELAKDDDSALWAILNFKVRVDLQHGAKTFAIKELASMAGGEIIDDAVTQKLAKDTLRSWDIRYISPSEARIEGFGQDGLLIDPRGSAAQGGLKGTRYMNAAKEMLQRRGGEAWKPSKVGRGRVAKTVRAVFMPMDIVTGEGEDNDEE